MKEYVTYIITYNGSKLPKYYIGSTSKSKISNGYLGSIKSKKWKSIFKEEIKNNKNLFEIKILNEFETRKEALIDEYNIQKQLNVVESADYFNESFASINGFFGMNVEGSSNPMYGKKNEVVAINIKTNEKLRISKEEFEKNENLRGITYGFIPVIDKDTNEKIQISKNEFYLNKDKYIHHNKNRFVSQETKDKLSAQRKNMTLSRDIYGNFLRVHKDDIRFQTGEIGNASSTYCLIIDLDGNKYRTFNLKKFFNDNNLQFPRPENINSEGVISFKKISKKYKSTNGWKIIKKFLTLQK